MSEVFNRLASDSMISIIVKFFTLIANFSLISVLIATNEASFQAFTLFITYCSIVAIFDLGLKNTFINFLNEGRVYGFEQVVILELCSVVKLMVGILFYIFASVFLSDELFENLVEISFSNVLFFLVCITIFSSVHPILLNMRHQKISLLLQCLPIAILLGVALTHTLDPYETLMLFASTTFVLNAVAFLIISCTVLNSNSLARAHRGRPFNLLTKYVKRARTFKTASLFFLMQLCAVLLYQVDKLLVVEIFGLSALTEYDIVWRYAWLAVMVHSIVSTQYWPMLTQELASFREGVRVFFLRVEKLTFAFASGTVILFLAHPIYEYAFQLPRPPDLLYALGLLMAASLIVSNFYSMSLNALSVLGAQILSALASVCFKFAVIFLGLVSSVNHLVLLTIVCNLLVISIVMPLAHRKIGRIGVAV